MGVNWYLANLSKKELSTYLGKSDEFDLTQELANAMKAYSWSATDKIVLIDDDWFSMELAVFTAIYLNEKPAGIDDDDNGPFQRAADIFFRDESMPFNEDEVRNIFDTFKQREAFPRTSWFFDASEPEAAPVAPVAPVAVPAPTATLKVLPKAPLKLLLRK
jgi:hypothetical protein